MMGLRVECKVLQEMIKYIIIMRYYTTVFITLCILLVRVNFMKYKLLFSFSVS